MNFIDTVDYSKLLKITDDFFIDENSLLGTGSFGQVYKGYCKSKKMVIAVKHIQVSEDYQRQIQTLKVLSTLIHPNIMGFYGYEHRTNDVYMFMEYCPNGTLTSVVKNGLTELQVLKYFRQMVEGMCYMNAKGKMHRDLKPDNILIGLDNDLKISDFGLARETQNIMITGKKGTPIYAGPQVYLDEKQGYTQKCDVWGGGMILYEMLTGQLLFKDVKTYSQLKKQWQCYEKGAKRVKYHNDMHPLWEYFTNIMLTFDPNKRPTFHQVLQILKKTYDQMQSQIKNKKGSKIKNPKLLMVQKLLNFQTQKFDILITIAEQFASIDFQLRNSIKYTCIFLCLARYLCHMKKLIRDLKHKNINVPNYDEQIIQDQKKDYEIILIMDKYRNIFDTQYTYYSDQLKNTIVEKLLNDYLQRSEQKQFFKSIPDIVQLIKDVQGGLFDIESAYREKLRELLVSKQLIIPTQRLQKQKQEALKLYIRVLLGGILDQSFPQEKCQEENMVKSKLQLYLNGDKKELLYQIQKLKKQLVK